MRRRPAVTPTKPTVCGGQRVNVQTTFKAFESPDHATIIQAHRSLTELAFQAASQCNIAESTNTTSGRGGIMTKQVTIDLSDEVYEWLDERRRALKLKTVGQIVQQLIDERRLMGW
jgi:hypothetical protein